MSQPYSSKNSYNKCHEDRHNHKSCTSVHYPEYDPDPEYEPEYEYCDKSYEECIKDVTCCEADLFCTVIHRFKKEVYCARNVKELTEVINMVNSFLMASAMKEKAIAASISASKCCHCRSKDIDCCSCCLSEDNDCC